MLCNIEDVAAGKEIDEGLFDRVGAKLKGGMASLGQKGKNFMAYMRGDKDAIKDPAVAKAYAQVATISKDFEKSSTETINDLKKIIS